MARRGRSAPSAWRTARTPETSCRIDEHGRRMEVMSREHEDVRSVGSVEPRGRPEILIVIAGARAHSSCEGRHEFGSGRARTGTESEASTVHVCFGQQEWSRHCMRVLGNRDVDGPRPRSARGTASHGRRNIKARALSTRLHLSCSTPTIPPRTPSTLLNRRHA